MGYGLLIRSPLEHFQFLAMMGKAPVNILAQVFCGHNVFIFLGSVHRSGIVGSKEAATSCSRNNVLCSVDMSIRNTLLLLWMILSLSAGFLQEPLPECFQGQGG